MAAELEDQVEGVEDPVAAKVAAERTEHVVAGDGLESHNQAADTRPHQEHSDCGAQQEWPRTDSMSAIDTRNPNWIFEWAGPLNQDVT